MAKPHLDQDPRDVAHILFWNFDDPSEAVELAIEAARAEGDEARASHWSQVLHWIKTDFPNTTGEDENNDDEVYTAPPLPWWPDEKT